MKALVLLLLGFSFLAHAQEIRRYQAENDHFRDYTREELTSRFLTTRHLLPAYSCDGINEFNPFYMPRLNLNKDSLRIKIPKTDIVFIYQEGKLIPSNGSSNEGISHSFIRSALSALKKLEAIPETKEMLRSLEQASYPVTITLGNNSFSPVEADGTVWRGIYMAVAISVLDHGRFTSEEGVHFYDIGVGGNVFWNPAKPDGLPNQVTLAHELFHALDATRGLLDMRFVEAEDHEFAFVSEYRAVYFENIARKAAGVDYRTHYGQDISGAGVLDAQGNPRFISAPCLK